MYITTIRGGIIVGATIIGTLIITAMTHTTGIELAGACHLAGAGVVITTLIGAIAATTAIVRTTVGTMITTLITDTVLITGITLIMGIILMEATILITDIILMAVVTITHITEITIIMREVAVMMVTAGRTLMSAMETLGAHMIIIVILLIKGVLIITTIIHTAVRTMKADTAVKINHRKVVVATHNLNMTIAEAMTAVDTKENRAATMATAIAVVQTAHQVE